MPAEIRLAFNPFAILLVAVVTCYGQPLARADDSTPAAGKQTPRTSAGPLRAPEVDPAEIENWPPNQPPPTGYRWGSKPHKAIVQSGAALWGLAFLPSFYVGMIGNGDLLQSTTATAWLMVPIAGPFVLLGEATGSTARALLIADGAFQAVGASMLTLGLLWRVPILVREEKTASAVRPRLVLQRAGFELGAEGTF